jgi:hypothetical protein
MSGLQVWTRKRPFPGMNDVAILLNVLQGRRPRRPTSDDCGGQVFPESLWELVQRCWAQAPESRPTMNGVVNDLSLCSLQLPQLGIDAIST